MRHVGIFIRRYGRQLTYCLKSASHSCCNRTQKSLPCRAICFVVSLILIPFAVILVLVALPVIYIVLFLLIFAYYGILYSPFVAMCEFGMKLTCEGELRNICSKIHRLLMICACFFSSVFCNFLGLNNVSIFCLQYLRIYRAIWPNS